MPELRTLTEQLQNAIFVRYGLQKWTTREKALHKRADRICAP